MGIEYEKELYSRMEALRSDLEAEYNRNSSLVAELKRLRSDFTMTAAWERRALDAEEALHRVRDAIINADPDVLTCTLWMPLSPAETVVDYIDAFLGTENQGG